MANRTFLITTAEPTKPLPGQYPEGGELLTAVPSIPVFWYMLFDESGIMYGPSDIPNVPPYPHLTTSTAEGLARVERRWEDAEHVFGRQLRVLFQTWLGFVRDRARDYLHCETEQWFWMFRSPAEFEQELRACLAAFDHIPEANGWNDHWEHLFGQAHVSRSLPRGNQGLCGATSYDEVPWWEDPMCVTGAMNEKVQNQVVFGTGPDDLARYLETVHSPVDRVLQVACRCGSVTFRLRKDNEGLGRRTCASCGARQCVLNSGAYWDESKANDWACKGCGGAEANLAIALDLVPGRDSAEFVHIGARCLACNRLAYAAGWEFGPSLDQLDDSGNEVWELIQEGRELVVNKQPDAALTKFASALALSLTEVDTFRRGESLLGIASGLFGLERWEECWQRLTELLDAGFGNNGEPDPETLLGLCLHELGRVEEGMEWLLPRYLDRGESIFDDLESKYRDRYRPKLLAALTRDDYLRAIREGPYLIEQFKGIPAEWQAEARRIVAEQQTEVEQTD